MERLSCLEHVNDQTDATIAAILLKAVEGGPWDLHAQIKHGSEFVFARTVKDISDSIHINKPKTQRTTLMTPSI